MAYRANRRKRKNKFATSLMGFVRQITSPTQLSPEVQKVTAKVDSCIEHCIRKVEQLVPKTGD